MKTVDFKQLAHSEFSSLKQNVGDWVETFSNSQAATLC